MPTSEWYKQWFNSGFYHKLYFQRNDTEAQHFIENMLAYLKPQKNCRMLDVACGRGRHSKFLASKGYNVTGIDISFESIAYARQFETANLQFYQHDMRLPFWINYFDYVFNFFTSFGYFNTSREHNDAMRTITQGLKPTGVLLFDYLNVHYAEDRLVPHELKTIDNTSYEIVRWDDEQFFYKKITVTDAALQEPLVFTEKVAKFNLGDFTEMLSFQNMQITDVFGDYELNSYDIRATPRMIILAKKR